MPVKSTKRAPKTPPALERRGNRWQAYVTERTVRHPWAALTVVATMVAVLSGISPMLLAAFNYYETHAQAIAAEDRLHAEIAVNRLQADRNLAWASVQSIKTEITVSRNRVNDCDIAEQNKVVESALERQTCNQYRADLQDAVTRFADARKTALLLSQGKPDPTLGGNP